jgi:hypothetical protein
VLDEASEALADAAAPSGDVACEIAAAMIAALGAYFRQRAIASRADNGEG